MTSMFRKSLPLVVVGVSMLALASVGIASRDESTPVGFEVAQVDAIEPAAKESLSVLGRSREGLDSMPAEIEDKVDEHADFGMNPRLSRMLIANTTVSLYLVPARDHVCLSLVVGQGAGFSCRATDDVARGTVGAATTSMEGGGIAIYGLVPDDVESVFVQTGEAGQVEVPAENNAYYTVLPAGTPVRTVRYVGPSGPVVYPISDPAMAFEES